jgi:hypothetical protein
MGQAGYEVVTFHVKDRYNENIIDVFLEDPKRAFELIGRLLGDDENTNTLLENSIISHVENIMGRSIEEELYDKGKFYSMAREYLLRLGINILPR